MEHAPTNAHNASTRDRFEARRLVQRPRRRGAHADRIRSVILGEVCARGDTSRFEFLVSFQS